MQWEMRPRGSKLGLDGAVRVGFDFLDMGMSNSDFGVENLGCMGGSWGCGLGTGMRQTNLKANITRVHRK